MAAKLLYNIGMKNDIDELKKLAMETETFFVLINNKYYVIRSKKQLMDMIEQGIKFIIIE